MYHWWGNNYINPILEVFIHILCSCAFTANKGQQSFPVKFYRFIVEIGRCPLEFPTTLWNAGTHLAIGNWVADKKRALEKVIMPRQSRENTIEKNIGCGIKGRKLTFVKDRNANSDAYSRAKKLVRIFSGKWKTLQSFFFIRMYFIGMFNFF